MSTNTEVRGQLPGEDSLTGESFGPLGRRLSRKKNEWGVHTARWDGKKQKGCSGKKHKCGVAPRDSPQPTGSDWAAELSTTVSGEPPMPPVETRPTGVAGRNHCQPRPATARERWGERVGLAGSFPALRAENSDEVGKPVAGGVFKAP